MCVFSRNASHIHLVCISLRVCASGSMMEYDTENMNSEEIYSSLRGVTEAIQSFSYRSQEDLNEPIRQEGKRDDAVSHNGFSNCSRHVDFSSNHNDINPLLFSLLSNRQEEKAWRPLPALTPVWVWTWWKEVAPP